jgi:site-specific DNA-methyltransferase (adenine-specific)
VQDDLVPVRQAVLVRRRYTVGLRPDDPVPHPPAIGPCGPLDQKRDARQRAQERTPVGYVRALRGVLREVRRVLKPTGSLFLNLGDTYFGRWASIRPRGRQGFADEQRVRRRTPSGGWLHDKQLLMLPARFAIAMQEDGWILRNDVIWAKPHVAPRPERDRLRSSHEHFFHFVQRRRGGRPSYFYDLAGAEAGALDVVRVQPRSGGNGHPATFPPDLVGPRIASSSPVGGVVVDPFCGAGTTLAVAIEEGRNAIGFDVSETYVKIASAHLADLHPAAAATT